MMTGKGSRFVLAVKGTIVVLTVCLTFFVGSQSFAQTCPDLVGDWDYSSNWANYDPSIPGYSFTTQTGIIHITNQSNCVFYGTVERVYPSASIDPVTGAIYNLINMTMTTGDSTLHGILYAYNLKRGLFRKINYSTSNIGIDGGDQTSLGTSQGKAIRRW
jgi:hypothetical protein